MKFKLKEQVNNYKMYKGYYIVFKNNGQVTILNKEQKVLRSDLTEQEAIEMIDDWAAEKLKEKLKWFKALAISKRNNGVNTVTIEAKDETDAFEKLKVKYGDMYIRKVEEIK